MRLARWILEGVRNGRSLGELLGVRFERAVKGTPAEAHLAALRTRFAPATGFGVLDGLRLQQDGPGTITEPAVLVAAEGMSDALDAVADALTAEAVYQIVKGNPENALATLERIAKGEEPPALTVTQSPTPGVRLTHRVAVVLPANATAPGWPAVVRTPRANAEPLLDAWCGLMLGPANAVTLVVEHAGGSLPVPLPSLGIAAIDVVMAGRDGGRELAERVVRAALAGQPGLVEPRVRADRPWKDLVGLCGAVAAVITHASPLGADAFEVPSALPAAPDEDAGDLAAARARSGSDPDRAARRARGGARSAERGDAGCGFRHPRARPDAAGRNHRRPSGRRCARPSRPGWRPRPRARRAIGCARSSAATCPASSPSRPATRRR